MNHQKHYDLLIQKRLANPATGYTERHHILPRALGGSDDPSNLVVLTGREHWVAHLLLHKIHRKPQTAHACHMMAMRCEERDIPHVRNSRMYESIRIECAKHVSKRMKKVQNGKGNSQYGTMWICSIDLQKNKKIKKDDLVPEGWIFGRDVWKLKKPKNYNRKKLNNKLIITDGVKKRILYFEDQLPIPSGWYIGAPPMDKKTKEKLSEFWSNNKRPYRVGLKYKRRVGP